MRKFSLLGLVATTLLAGCNLAPSYERPALPVATQWPIGSAAQLNDSAQAPAALIAWPNYFTDPDLQRLIKIALQNNRDLRISALQVEQARAQFQIRRADQFPNLNATGTASRAVSVPGGNPASNFNVGLGVAAWEIDFFGRVANLKEQALAQYLASEEGRNAAQISLVAAVANSWLRLIADQELLDLAKQTAKARKESSALMRLRLENGVTSELDYRQTESLAEAANVALAQAQRQRMQDENALVLLLGQALPAEVSQNIEAAHFANNADCANANYKAKENQGTQQVRLDNPNMLTTLPAGLPSDLLTLRPDIRQAEQQLIAANANIGAARAAFFPRISLTAQLGSASNELSGLFESGSEVWSIVPQLTLPIFDAGRNRANLSTARAGRDIAVAQYEKSIQTAFREVADTLAGQATWGEQLRAQEAQAEAEKVRLDLSNLRYENGVTSYLDLLDAQRASFTAQQAVVAVRLAQLQNKVDLYKVLGGGSGEVPEVDKPATQANESKDTEPLKAPS